MGQGGRSDQVSNQVSAASPLWGARAVSWGGPLLPHWLLCSAWSLSRCSAQSKGVDDPVCWLLAPPSARACAGSAPTPRGCPAHPLAHQGVGQSEWPRGAFLCCCAGAGGGGHRTGPSYGSLPSQSLRFVMAVKQMAPLCKLQGELVQGGLDGGGVVLGRCPWEMH